MKINNVLPVMLTCLVAVTAVPVAHNSFDDLAEIKRNEDTNPGHGGYTVRRTDDTSPGRGGYIVKRTDYTSPGRGGYTAKRDDDQGRGGYQPKRDTRVFPGRGGYDIKRDEDYIIGSAPGCISPVDDDGDQGSVHEPCTEK